MDNDPPKTRNISFQPKATKALIEKKTEPAQLTISGEGTSRDTVPHPIPLSRTYIPDHSAAHGVEGFVDELTLLGASGWAWVPNSPTESVEIEAVFKEQKLGGTTANILRPDLKAAGKGTGLYGFRLVFDQLFTGHGRPTLRASSGAKFTDLVEHPFADDHDLTTKVGVVEGLLEQLSSQEALGWAWLPEWPAASVNVIAVLDGQLVGRGTADIMRSDLFASRRGTGRYGFALVFKEPIANIERLTIEVTHEDHSVSLPVLPSALQKTNERWKKKEGASAEPGPGQQIAPVEAHIDSLSRWNATGWAWDPRTPQRALQIEALLDGVVIGRAVADNMRMDLLQHGIGTGLYGFEIRFFQPLKDTAPTFRLFVPVLEISSSFDLTRLSQIASAEDYMPPEARLSSLLAEHAKFTSQGPEFEEHDPAILKSCSGGSSPRPLIVAFYLPQFHAIPENDTFWGKGFTEWRQLPRSIPRFPGHYQPRIPRDLGFYNPANPQHLQAQADLALVSGISAFAFYYYWFNSRRVLEKPLESLLGSDVEMPFMIIWANENWTRTWDGSSSQVLLHQDYLLEDEAALLGDLARHFADHRYLRIEDRPLFCIYNPQAIPDAKQTIHRWRRCFQERHKVNPLLFMCQTFGSRDPRPFGLDGAMEFPPHKLSERLIARPAVDAYSPDYQGQILSYDDFVSASLEEKDPDYTLIKTGAPGWDNDPRRPNRACSVERSSPRKYELWLHALLNRALDHPVNGTAVVAINAWNEWAECAYLEPDVYYGAAYLNATARALRATINESAILDSDHDKASFFKVSVVIPNYNHGAYIVERINSILKQTWTPDEIVFLDDCSSDNSLGLAVDLLKKHKVDFKVIVNEKNSGSVFRQWMKGIHSARNDLIWIAESDDVADPRFLERLLPAFEREDTLLAFGRIECIDVNGRARSDLSGYFDGLKTFCWHRSVSVPAFTAFKHDFIVKNVIPNVSGSVFRKPTLTSEETSRLNKYRFAGDWYFYALVARGGQISFRHRACSFFRVAETSVSRDAFSSDRHIGEHAMILEDLGSLYSPEPEALQNHIRALATHFPDLPHSDLIDRLALKSRKTAATRRLRVCIAAHSFTIGGGELMPVELANALKQRGHHITYLVIEKDIDPSHGDLRRRLHANVPVIYWQDISTDISGFVGAYGIEVFNSHNISVEWNLSAISHDVGIPFIGSLHGGYEASPELVTPDFLAYVLRNVGTWLYLSDKNRKALAAAGIPESRFLRSFNALPEIAVEKVDCASFRSTHGITSDAIVFVICSRATEDKGWQVAVDVVRQLTARHHNVHLVLIGDGPDAKELRQRNEDLPFVTFLGHFDKPSRLLPCFDIGIFPSVFLGETFPLFLLECFQAGLPVVSSDIGEIPYIMGYSTQTSPGIMVDHRQDRDQFVGSMADAAAKIIGNKLIRRNMGRHAKKTFRRFSMKSLVDLYEDTMFALVRDSSQPSPDIQSGLHAPSSYSIALKSG